jgi:hypothetical protein
MTTETITYRLPLSGVEVESSVPLPPTRTGDGEHTSAPDLFQIRRDLGLPVAYRAGGAAVGSAIYGPRAEHVPEYMRYLRQYLSLSGDPVIKAWEASCFLLRVHPWRDGNGRTARRMYREITGYDGPDDALRQLFITHTLR